MNCEHCHDTGYVGDNGPGLEGNREVQPCDQCDSNPAKCECQMWAREYTREELNQPPTHHPNCGEMRDE